MRVLFGNDLELCTKRSVDWHRSSEFEDEDGQAFQCVQIIKGIRAQIGRER